MPSTYRVRVYEHRISDMFSGGGEVSKYGQSIRRKISNRATVLAPRTPWASRQRKLFASHRDGGELKVGRYKIRGSVVNIADHAVYVALGVSGTIKSPRGGKARMVIPRTKGMPPLRAGAGWAGLRPVKRVRGQRPNGGSEANNWMNRAARDVLAREGVH